MLILRNIIKDLLAITAVSFLTIVLMPIFIEVGGESNGKGWVETFFSAIIVSTLAIFLIETKTSIMYKLLGIISVAMISCSLILLWFKFGPIELTLLILGYPLLLTFCKTFYTYIIEKYKKNLLVIEK